VYYPVKQSELRYEKNCVLLFPLLPNMSRVWIALRLCTQPVSKGLGVIDQRGDFVIDPGDKSFRLLPAPELGMVTPPDLKPITNRWLPHSSRFSKVEHPEN
jgi:hypothetical protein